MWLDCRLRFAHGSTLTKRYSTSGFEPFHHTCSVICGIIWEAYTEPFITCEQHRLHTHFCKFAVNKAFSVGAKNKSYYMRLYMCDVSALTTTAAALSERLGSVFKYSTFHQIISKCDMD